MKTKPSRLTYKKKKIQLLVLRINDKLQAWTASAVKIKCSLNWFIKSSKFSLADWVFKIGQSNNHLKSTTRLCSLIQTENQTYSSKVFSQLVSRVLIWNIIVYTERAPVPGPHPLTEGMDILQASFFSGGCYIPKAHDLSVKAAFTLHCLLPVWRPCLKRGQIWHVLCFWKWSWGAGGNTQI